MENTIDQETYDCIVVELKEKGLEITNSIHEIIIDYLSGFHDGIETLGTNYEQEKMDNHPDNEIIASVIYTYPSLGA